MINGQQKSHVFTALQWVEMSKWNFHLTGSRFFGNTHAKSDWDFFAEYSNELDRELRENGWKRDSNKEYTHRNSTVVIYYKENVHIQLVKNLEMKIKIQDKLAPVFREIVPTKEIATLIWRMAEEAYTLGVNARMPK